MGVQGLWTLVSPAARPVKLESLRDRKLAIDASIWIHQFMRTMRSEDGSVLRNGHTLGFFRRICKLLFYNIKPVFVFDGVAPILKRSTIRERRKRRQGIQENIKKTAEKILKAQMKAQLLLDEQKRRSLAAIGDEGTKGTVDSDGEENYVYLEELDNSAALDTLRHQNAIKQDQYQLPPLAIDDNSKQRKMDPRLASDQELLEFIDEFKPSDVDMDSSVFQALPPEIQYEIIQDLKLKSRQTSWSRLDNMVRQSKTPLDFSKQQILQLKHRNEMTQRVIHMNDMASQQHQSANNAPSRIASERGKEYLLVKNENVEQGLGWRLPGTQKPKPESDSTQQQQPVIDDGDMGDDGPKVMVSSDIDIPTTTTMEEEDDMDDPVARAVASNPRLAALMGNFDNGGGYGSGGDDLVQTDSFEGGGKEEDDYMSQEQNYDTDDVGDDTPLFTNYQHHHDQQNELLSPAWDDYEQQDDYGQQDGNDAALDQILSKMYEEDQHNNAYVAPSATGHQQQYVFTTSDSQLTSSTVESGSSDISGNAELELDADTFYQLWLSRVPDAFMYMHSFNDEYKTILKNAIYDTTTVSDLTTQLKSVQKVSGKSNANDAMQQDAFAFHQNFLTSALAWKQRLVYEQTLLAMYQQEHNKTTTDETTTATATTIATPLDEEKMEPLVISDDDAEDDDIQLVDIGDQQTASTIQQQDTTQGGPVDTSRETEAMDDTTPLQREFLSSTLLGTEMGNNISQVDDDTGEDGNKKSELMMDGMDLKSPGTLEDRMQKGKEDEQVIELAEEAMDVGYNSDEELAAGDVVQEENDEFARFVSDIASRDIGSVRQELQDDVQQLNKEQTKQMGNADTISDQMVQDIQELLQLFGVPYVISPMEAEAQCAYLLEHNLVDGVVTDDSDVFLFGGERVYKNMFSQQKYVECYLLQDIAREMHLDRKKLIQLAYFLGSDYTPGIPGIGYVSAMEILAAFDSGDDDDDDDNQPLESPLHRFKIWFEGGLDKTEFEKKFRKKHKHLDIPADFPNPLIKDAYYSPLVDSSLEKFSWSPPQLDSLRLYLMKSFSWSEGKIDEILIPVIREMNERQATGVQTSISSFFDTSAGLQASNRPTGMKRKHKSKRIQQVVKQFGKRNQKPDTNNDSSDSGSDDSNVSGNPKRRLSPRK